MQALIDFEGWRKWRGFMDSPGPSPAIIDSAASPMQGGYISQIPQEDPQSPSSTRTAKQTNGAPRPSFADSQIMREDSWGSGSPNSVDSPSSPQTLSTDDAPTSDARTVSE